MTPERWRQIASLYELAHLVSPEALTTWLDAQCGDDAELRCELAALLAFGQASGVNIASIIGNAAVAWADSKPEDSTATIVNHEISTRAGAGTPRCPVCTGALPPDAHFCPKCGAAAELANARTHTALAPGAMVSERYRIVTLLGRGGLGEVYRATDILLDQEVALKFLPESVVPDARALSRVRQEVKLARQITHPNVCRVFDIGHMAGRPFLSMEYVDGEDLDSLLHRIGRLPAGKANVIAASLCLGVAAAHAKGVLHRDLKPSNIMIDSQGEVRIVDFGLAALAGRVTDPRSGTPKYMAPEQVAGQEVTQQTDLYSLGVVIHLIFTGCLPETNAEKFIDALPDVDPAIKNIVEKCLEHDPSTRPVSALAVAAAIPGGNPLAAMVAAGETPSPELVARAGDESAIPVRHAVYWMIAAFTGLIACLFVSGHIGFFARISMPNSPSALEQRTRDILHRLGHIQDPRDSASWFSFDTQLLGDIERRTGLLTRLTELRASEPSVARFWYRQDRFPLYSLTFGRSGHVTATYDPLPREGSVRVQLDAHGHLVALSATPVEGQTSNFIPDWREAFAAAGLEIAAFERTEPKLTLTYASDQRFGWVQKEPKENAARIRVEAALQGGRVSYFYWRRDSADSAAPPASEKWSMAGSALWFGLVALIILCAAWISADAFWRQRRIDRRGAQRLFVFSFGIEAAANLLRVSWAPIPFVILLQLGLALATALLEAYILVLLYLSIELFARRHHPWLMIGWARMLAGRLKDSAIGREVLIGAAIGLWFTIPMTLRYFDWTLAPLGPSFDMDVFENASELAAGVLSNVPFSLGIALLLTIVLLLSRMGLQKARLFSVLPLSVILLLPWIWVPYRALQGVLWILMLAVAPFLMRAGFLAIVTGVFVNQIAILLPLAWGVPRWQFPYAFAAASIVALLIVFGFRNALAGRPFIPRTWLAE